MISHDSTQAEDAGNMNDRSLSLLTQLITQLLWLCTPFIKCHVHLSAPSLIQNNRITVVIIHLAANKTICATV